MPVDADNVGADRIIVSIHAPRCRGAMPLSASGWVPTPLFQSTPPVAGGRCNRMPVPDRHDYRSFNPRPPLPGGDAGRDQAAGGTSMRFNPRPPLPGGDARLALPTTCRHKVSIHAPRCRGAMRRQDQAFALHRMFQSTPPVAGGRCLAKYQAAHDAHLFQSTPPVAGGRCLLFKSPKDAVARFNPRPPLPGGDA